MFRSILVLESTWETGSAASYSVYPFLKGFARASRLKPFHQHFSDARTFAHWVRVFDQDAAVPKPKLLYIAAHGDKGYLTGMRNRLEFPVIRRVCKRAHSIEYVHFGSCYFGGEKNLSRLLRSAGHLKWASGFEGSVDWMESLLFDLLFLGRVVDRQGPRKGRWVQGVTGDLLRETPGLAHSLKFRLQYRLGDSIRTLSSEGISSEKGIP